MRSVKKEERKGIYYVWINNNKIRLIGVFLPAGKIVKTGGLVEKYYFVVPIV